MNEGPVRKGVAFRHDLLRVSLVSRLLYCLFLKNKSKSFLIYFITQKCHFYGIFLNEIICNFDTFINVAYLYMIHMHMINKTSYFSI